jgi:hypothetical protein
MATTPKAKKQAFNKTSLMAALTASAVLKPERVTIEALGGDLFAKRMTVGERDDYFDEMAEVTTGSGNAEAFARAVVDEDGVNLFDANDIDDLAIIRKLPPEVVTEVLQKFYTVNRFTSKTEQIKKDGENDLKKS